MTKQKWSMSKMTKKVDSYCKKNNVDPDTIGYYGDTENDYGYIWNCERPDGHKFKVITNYEDGKISIIE